MWKIRLLLFILGLYLPLTVSVKEEYEQPLEYELMTDLVKDEAGGVKATCGLQNVPLDTSPSNPFTIGPVPETLGNGVEIWRSNFFGRIEKTAVDQASDWEYTTSAYTATYYRIRGNAKSSSFVKDKNRRIMTRWIILYCVGGGSQRYYFEIPMQDVSPPVFLKPEYTFDITPDWNPRVPISQGQFVIVGDDAREIEDDNDFLVLDSSIENLIGVVPHRMWVEPYPKIFYFRLDIYIKDTVVLTPGQKIQVGLTARDQFNSAYAILNINVAQ